jgi:hypothetical protein
VVLKRTSVALLLSVPASLLYAIVYASTLASHAAEDWNASPHTASFEEWHGETTAELAILAWFAALLAMFIGTIAADLIGAALRSWKGEAAVIEELREDYARRHAGEDVTPGKALRYRLGRHRWMIFRPDDADAYRECFFCHMRTSLPRGSGGVAPLRS